MILSAGILAGGRSSRMGSNKALLPFQGRPLIQRQIDVLQPLSDDLMIGANDPRPYSGFGLRVVPDLLPEPCALTGIHALLAGARHPFVFVVACDLPFLNSGLIRHLIGQAEGADAVLPLGARGPEPLFALYSKTCLPAIERAAAAGLWKATGFLKGLRVCEVPIREEEWRIDGHSPIFNANTPEDWRDVSKSS